MALSVKYEPKPFPSPDEVAAMSMEDFQAHAQALIDEVQAAVTMGAAIEQWLKEGASA